MIPKSVAREAATLGMKYAGCAWIPHTGDFDEKTCRAAIAVFNHAGEVLAAHGIKFFYHTHGYEFQPFGEGTLFDLLVTGTESELRELRDGHLLDCPRGPRSGEAAAEIQLPLEADALERHEKEHTDGKRLLYGEELEPLVLVNQCGSGNRQDRSAGDSPGRETSGGQVVVHRGRITPSSERQIPPRACVTSNR